MHLNLINASKLKAVAFAACTVFAFEFARSDAVADGIAENLEAAGPAMGPSFLILIAVLIGGSFIALSGFLISKRRSNAQRAEEDRMT